MQQSAEALTKAVGGGDFVLELGVNLVEADVGGGAGGEAAVGVKGDARTVQVFECGFDAGDDGFGSVDVAGLAGDAAEADLDVVGELFEDGHVAYAGRSEFHRDMANVETGELLENRIVAAAVVGFA